MNASRNAAHAYAAASAHRSLREQEADVFRRAGTALRRGRDLDHIGQARAVADNDRLWSMVLDLVRDPGNALPPPLRAGIASVALAVQRELRASTPDIDFVAAVNENMAKGLVSFD